MGEIAKAGVGVNNLQERGEEEKAKPVQPGSPRERQPHQLPRRAAYRQGRRLITTPHYDRTRYRRRKRPGPKGGRFAYGPRSLNQLGGQARAGEHPLFEKLCEYDTLVAAWQALRKGRTLAARRFAGAADRVSMENFERKLEGHLKHLSYLLRSGKYRPGPINAFQVAKPGGGTRVVNVLTVKDRVAQRAALGLLEELFEPGFLESSYAFRPDRSIYDALEQVERHYAEGWSWAVDADIESFFDRILRGRLYRLLARRIADRRMLALLELWLDHTPAFRFEPVIAQTPFPPEISSSRSPAPRPGRGSWPAEEGFEENTVKAKDKGRVTRLTRRLLEDGLDLTIERLGSEDNRAPYRVTPYALPRHLRRSYPNRAYGRGYAAGENEDIDDDNRSAGEYDFDYEEAYGFGYTGGAGGGEPDDNGWGREILRRVGPDGALWGLSVARKLLKHGLPHLPHGLGWVLRGGATLGAAGAAGAALGAASYWAFRQWRKAPTLYEVETAHFQEEAGRQRAAHTSQPALSRNNAIGEHGVAPRSLRPGESANANQWPQPAQEGRGIAQGSILSPLYSNIYLHEFDLAITARGYRLVRYADDLLILCRSQREAYRALAQAEEVLAEMGLNFKPSKTRIAPLAEGFKFLGAELGANGRWKNLPGGEPGNPNGSLGQTNTHWLERARQSWLGRAVRTKPGIVQKGRAKKIK